MNYFLNLKEMPKKLNDPLILNEKNEILKLIKNKNGNNNTFYKEIFFTCDFKFGNLLVILNKLIFYCEIIGCKFIFLDKDIFWFITHKINISIYNITIEAIDKSKYNNSFSTFYDPGNLFYNFFNIKPEVRIHYLKNEILSNLPKIYLSPRDLTIHIRSGDIFTIFAHSPYAQPPLCFYENILNYFKFNKVYLISQDNSNPVINYLLYNFPFIINKKNSLKNDIGLLINSYNIICSISSFLNSIIQINFNLKYLWDYKIYKTIEKIRQYHYDLYKIPNKNFTLFRMKPSINYDNIMYNWKNNKKQIKLMIKEKCINSFKISYIHN